MAKRSRPWAEDIEKAIAKAYDQGVGDALAEVRKKMAEVYELASKIMQRMAGYRPKSTNPTVAELRAIEDAEAPAPKRKAVTANSSEVNAAFEVICNTKPPFSPLSPQNVAAVWRGEAHAYRKAGAALKALVADGRAVVKRGKYAQAQPAAQTADGATSEAP